MKLWQRKKTPAGGGGTEGRWTRYLEIQRSRIFSSAPGVSTFPTSAPGARAAEGKSKGPQPNLLRDFFSLLPPASVVAACFFTTPGRPPQESIFSGAGPQTPRNYFPGKMTVNAFNPRACPLRRHSILGSFLVGTRIEFPFLAFFVKAR